jgi:UDP-N-acetylmuramyl pentapeptide phosphotransferase/UDP-N-acetylglucosamine-1-phosphate transferase
VRSGVAAAGATALAWQLLGRGPAGGERWHRLNHREHEVTLRLGPVVALGGLAGLAVARPRPLAAPLLVVSSAAAVGVYDDLYGDRHARGLAGHARALGDGVVTTGVVKLAVLAGSAAAGSALVHRQWADVALGTVLVAGGANLVNLFDLRPGRAAKLTVLSAVLLAGSGEPAGRAVAAVAAGAAAAALPPDLGEQAMLGDCGAATLGALLGWSAALGGSRRRRGLVGVGVVAMTLASERVSFSAVIERGPLLRALDRLGRRQR